MLDNRTAANPLQDRVDELEETIRQLRERLVPELIFPGEWDLEPAQSRIMAALVKNNVVRYDNLGFLNDASDNPRNLLSMQICKMRPKLAKFDIAIETRHRLGYFLPEESRKLATNEAKRATTMANATELATLSGPDGVVRKLLDAVAEVKATASALNQKLLDLRRVEANLNRILFERSESARVA